jgi:exopolyphosphatase/guanosine-5'-triphosphate,3'-diphosphate pyrophosphatase
VVRRAVNRDWFLSEALKRTGLNISVIGGIEEARLSVLGVLSVIGSGDGGARFVVDIGGGSTEFILTRGSEVLGTWSMDMGVVHLTEDHLKSDPPEEVELEAMEEEIGKVNEKGHQSLFGDGFGQDGPGPDGPCWYCGYDNDPCGP